ncbi:hypothetical protein CBM2617_B60340 [Cupriavidus taiwanensis]|nr:hypothetical protein CBM2617_B60340 [Cupriavidus taiwanensis]
MLPSPACGRGAGERAGACHSDGLHFVDAPALTPTLSRKREREHASGSLKTSGKCFRRGFAPSPASGTRSTQAGV